MNGADVICETLLANGVDVWFANPGTSEMHLVAALDRRPEIRCVLGLSEGVVTGAADGYARMTGRPAATLLHCGPGLANGLANLHNARRARTPIINIVGDHASYHLPYDPPLASNIASLAHPMSQWVGRTAPGGSVSRDIAAACHAARSLPGVATMIVPADVAWSEVDNECIEEAGTPNRRLPDVDAIELVAAALRDDGASAMMMLGGEALTEAGMEIAQRIAETTGAQLMAYGANARVERGRGRAPLELLPYPLALAIRATENVRTLICIGCDEPVAFFAYPGMPSRIIPDGCRVLKMGSIGDRLVEGLEALADRLNAGRSAPVAIALPPMPSPGRLTDNAISAIVAHGLPDDAIVCDESITSAVRFTGNAKAAARHDYLQLTGGSIGIGIPLAVGAATACPDRKVICLQADGSGMFTCQGLWTQARERMNVLTVIFANRSYAVLHNEMRNVGVASPGKNAQRMLDLTDPHIDWVAMAKAMGVEAARAETTEEFASLFEAAIRTPGPFLIEAVVPQGA